MKTRVLLGGCMAMVLIFSGCSSAEKKEPPAKKAVVSISPNATSEKNVSKNAVSKNTTSGNAPAQSQNAKTTGEKKSSTASGGEGGESTAENLAGTGQEGMDSGQEAVGSAEEGSMQQCPYCGEWYSTAPDGDLWNPYDRHVLEERDSLQADEQTYEYPQDAGAAAAEMVQCPDCGNWYEEGNIFRNHICEGN